MGKTYRKEGHAEEHADTDSEPGSAGSESAILPQNKDLKTPPGRHPEIGLWPALAQDCLLCMAADCRQLLCAACADDLPRLPATRCPRCALPTPAGETCGRCLAKPPHFDRTIAAYRYDFPLDKLIHAFKYGHRLALANFFGQALNEACSVTAADRIIPMPLHSERLRQRGFNQALELARPVAARLNTPLDAKHCLRTRDTRPQADLPWRERARNMRGAFHCTTDFSGQRLLLIDDVMTTGASLDECARTLKLHGAASVDVLVVARALPKSS